MTRKSFPRDKHSRVITILVPWPMRPDSLCKASLQRLSHTTSSIPPASRPPAKFANACGTWTRINYPKFSSSWYWKVRLINCGCTSIRKPFSSSVMFSPKIRLHMVVYASFTEDHRSVFLTSQSRLLDFASHIWTTQLFIQEGRRKENILYGLAGE